MSNLVLHSQASINEETYSYRFYVDNNDNDGKEGKEYEI